MIQNEEYIAFDIKGLFFYMLRQWKTIMVLCIIFAVLLGSFQAVAEYNTSQSVDMENSYWIEYQQYQEQVAFLENSITTTQNKIDTLQNYIQNSILMKADPQNLYIAKSIYYIDSGYQILPENTYQNPDKTNTLAWYYSHDLQDYSVYEEVGAQVGIEAKYLIELVNFSIHDEHTISISVSHPDEELAIAIMDIFNNKLLSLYQKLNETVVDHTITQMANSCGVYIDEALNAKQQEAHDEILTLQDSIIIYKNNLLTLKKDSAPDDLNILTTFIKWFILGGVLVGVVMFLILFITSVSKNLIHSSHQLTSSFRINMLGEIIGSCSKLSPASKTLNRMEGCLTENSEENLHYLAETIKNHCGDAKKILLCSDMDISLCNSLAESLNSYLSGVQLLSAGNILTQASALHALSECDAVVTLAFRDQSRNSIIRKMMHLITSLKKECIGFIFVY